MTLSPRFALLLALATLAACDRPSPLPDMGLSASAVVFEAPAAAGDPLPQSVYVTNTGAGSLARPSASIAYQDGAGWLSATVTGSGAPYEIRLGATVGTLPPGAYRATVTLASANASSSPLQVAATLDVPEPRFALSTASLAFAAPRGGGSPPPQDFQVTNGGRGLLPVPQVAISYVGATGWLSTVVGGTPDAYTVTTSADVTGLASGTYSATITLTAAGDAAPPRTMGVSLTVPPIELALSATTLDVQGTVDDGTPPPAELTASNAGGGLMPPPGYLIDPGAATWITGVEVIGAAPPYRVRILTSQVGLLEGSYTGKVWLGSVADGLTAMEAVVIQLHVPQMTLVVSPRELFFSWTAGCPPPAAQQVVLFGSRPGLAGPVTAAVRPEVSTWVEATVTGEREPYTVAVKLKGAPPVAAYTPIIVDLSAAGATTSYFFAYLYVNEVPPPVSFGFDPWSLQFHAQLGTGDPAPQRVQIHGGWACPAAPTASVQPPEARAWLSPQPAGSGYAGFLVRPHVADFTAGETRQASVQLGGFAYEASPGWPADGSPATPVVAVSVTAGALQAVSPLPAPRRGHVLLAHSSGEVHAIGGLDSGGILADIATFGETLGTWSTGLPPLPHPRYGAGAVELAGGDILVCGGTSATITWDQHQGTCDLHTASGWRSGGELLHGRNAPQLIELPGRKVLILGTTWPEVLDVDSRISTDLRMPSSARESGVLLPSGLVLIVGPSVFATLYEPRSGRLWKSGELPEALLDGTAALHLLPDGHVLALGTVGIGTTGTGFTFAGAAFTWDPATGAWSKAAAPPSAHDRTSTLSLANGSVLAWNGTGVSARSDELELFDPVSGTWSVVGRLPRTYLELPIAQAISGLIVMAGGMVDVSPGAEPAIVDTFTW